MPFLVEDLDAEETFGPFETFAAARAKVEAAKLATFVIWQGSVSETERGPFFHYERPLSQQSQSL